MSKSKLSNSMCPNTKASSHCCMTVIASPNPVLGYNDFLKARMRAADSCVNSSSLIKGLKGFLKIIETVSTGGSIPPARTQHGAYIEGEHNSCTFCSTSGTPKASAICYLVSWRRSSSNMNSMNSRSWGIHKEAKNIFTHSGT